MGLCFQGTDIGLDSCLIWGKCDCGLRLEIYNIEAQYIAHYTVMYIKGGYPPPLQDKLRIKTIILTTYVTCAYYRSTQTDLGPSLTAYKGQLCVAWKGAAGDTKMLFSQYPFFGLWSLQSERRYLLCRFR